MTRANLKFNVLYSMGNLDGEEAYEAPTGPQYGPPRRLVSTFMLNLLGR
jgi:hypothetical protein